MNVYTIIATAKPELAGQAVATAFPHDLIRVNDNAWLVAGTGTALEIAAKLGMPTTPGAGSPFSGVVTGIAGYYGYAPNNLWEWIAAKQAVPVNG